MKTPATFSARLLMAILDPVYGMKQAVLAKAVGYKNQSSIGNILSNPNRKGCGRTYQIAKTLFVEPLWLADGTGQMRKPETAPTTIAGRTADLDTIADIAHKLERQQRELLARHHDNPVNLIHSKKGVCTTDKSDTLNVGITPVPGEAELLFWYRRISSVNRRKLYVQAEMYCLADDPESAEFFLAAGLVNSIPKGKHDEERDSASKETQKRPGEST